MSKCLQARTMGSLASEEVKPAGIGYEILYPIFIAVFSSIFSFLVSKVSSFSLFLLVSILRFSILNKDFTVKAITISITTAYQRNV